VFVRSLVGLDREAAKRALAVFLVGTTPGANQIDLLKLVVAHLTEHGVMDPGRLYESPFADLTPRGPDGISNPPVADLVAILRQIEATGQWWLLPVNYP
jgi:type I restriction enzyme R subunit